MTAAEEREPLVRLERDGAIALVTIDHPPVNALSHAVRSALASMLQEVQANGGFAAAVIACAGRTFVAGADIREFDQPLRTPHLSEICDAIEASAKPIVVAVHGTALGGGCEIALAAHGRVLAEGAVLGLPEVKLGLIPGAGGTQRLPRLIEAHLALDLITSGRHLPAVRARELGLADDVVSAADLLNKAKALALALRSRGLRRASASPVTVSDRGGFAASAAKAAARARGQMSIAAAVEAIAGTLDASFEDGLRRERELFLQLRGSDQSKALRHLFFAERDAGRVEGLRGVAPRAVSTVGVVGAGTMGAGIAGACLAAKFQVRIVDLDTSALGRGRERARRILERETASGRLPPEEAAALLSTLVATNDMTALSKADFVIEAVFEDYDLKAGLLARLAKIAKPSAVLATNTSYLDVNGLAAACGRPRDVIGLHFFAPPETMKLAELVRARDSAPDAVATGLQLARRLGKIPVVVEVCDGFLGNRIFAMYRREMEYALEDGALPEEIDAAMEAHGFAMGPFAVADLSGLDIAWARRKRLAATRAPGERYVGVADELCEAGRFGRKAGAGWYAYRNGQREPDPFVTALVEKHSASRGIVRRPVSMEEIQRRARAAIVNEAAKVLAEGIAARPSDIDVAFVHGYGYPSWRGGPLYEADRVGLDRLLEDAERLHAANGIGFEPAGLLVELVDEGLGFADWPKLQRP
ncbi:MAG: enoyl-CoA hydratase/isomerase family protein [Methylobacteriaceae bacterium]|nr:enoyl-CoA hydratase/isomerase family protein [Methylobacteriaceae bacterium]